MSLVTVYKDDKELKCNGSKASIAELKKFGWSTTKPKKKVTKKAK